MKKTYIAPSIKNFQMESSPLFLSGSLISDETAEGGDAMSKSHKGGFVWEDDTEE